MGTYFFLLFILPVAIGGPINWDSDDFQSDPVYSSVDCSSSCTGSSKFNYEVGKRYVYDYEANTATNIEGASEGVARVDVKAKATIQVLAKCEMVLSLSDVTVKRSVPENSEMVPADDQVFKLSLERNSLRFSFQDGKIESLCPSQSDEPSSLNFKRGVLSVFQNSMSQFQNGENLKETDVTGTCPTSYSVTQKGWKTTEIMRTKDLLGCSDRHSYRTAFKSTPIDVPDTIKSLPLLKGNYKCVQIVTSEGKISTATCSESLVFRPFSKKESGAKTDTVQKLTYISTSATVNTRKDVISSRKNLLYEHENRMETVAITLWQARETLTQLCRITAQDLPVEVPDLFTDLVYAVRGLKSSSLTDIYEQIIRGSVCSDNKERMKKFFLDALPMAETSASVGVMVQMLLSGEVSGPQADYWLNSLHFVREPNPDMIGHLLKLVKAEKLQMKSFLPVSSLIKTYCQSNSDCSTNTDVSGILNVFNNILSNDCQASDNKLVIMTLRAAGNLGFSDQLATTLGGCMTSKDTSMMARVFAAQAFTGISCGADRQVLMQLLNEMNEDSELRIASYLSAMSCWNEKILQQVKSLLESETSNQVSSFVWTHLTNLMESSSPYKQALKDIVSDEVIKKKFESSNSKHSGNYEVSFFSEKFGAGATAESNLIWSSKSFLPRSAMVNLTVDMFGQSVQLLELGGRVEGIESLLQKFIGSKIFKGGEKVPDSSSSRCSKKEKLDQMKNEYSTEPNLLTASLYLRMFGHELKFQQFNEKEILALKEIVSGKMVTKDTSQEISFGQSLMFLESQMIVPTAAGMPLALSINGTASLELQAKVDFDVKKLKMRSTFDIKPSGAVLVSGLMSVKAGSTSAGLKMTTTLHTSTSVTGRIEANDNQVLSIDFDTPEKVMDILEVKTDFFMVHNKNEKKQEMLQNKRMKSALCTPDSVYKVTGYELCGTVSYVDASAVDNSPFMPLTGPMLLSLTLQKKDAPKGYKMVLRQVQNDDTSTANIAIDTSGSKVDRKINIGYYLDTKERKIDGEFISPWHKIYIKGNYPKQQSNNHEFSTSVTVDGEEYKLLLHANKKITKDKVLWTPKLEMNRPKDSKLLYFSPETISVSGTVEIVDNYREITTDLTASVASNEKTPLGKSLRNLLRDGKISLKGKYINKDKQKLLYGSVNVNQKDAYTATLQLVSDKKASSQKYEPTVVITTPETDKLFVLTGKTEMKDDKNLNGELQITMSKSLKEPIVFNVSYSKKLKSRYQCKGNLKSEFIVLNVEGQADVPIPFRGKKSPITNRWIIDYTLPMLRDKELRKNKLTINSKIHDESTKAINKYNAALNLDSKGFPESNFDANLQLSYKNSSTSSKLVVKHGSASKDKKIKDNSVVTVVLDLGHHLTDGSANITYDLQVLYPAKEIEYQVKGKHEHQLKQKFKLETYAAIIYQKGRTVEVRVMGNDNSKKTSLDVSGLLEVIFPNILVGNRMTEGGRYKVITTLVQGADKEYTHTVNLQLNEVKHSLVNKYKRSRDDFRLLSIMEVSGADIKKLTLKASKNAEVMEGLVALVLDKDTFSVGFNTSALNNQSQIFSWQVTVPERKVQSTIEIGNKKQNEAKFKADIQWDALRDPTLKVATNFNYLLDVDRYNFTLTLNTPFVNHTNYAFKRAFVHNSRELREELRLVLGRRTDEFSYTLSARLPLTLERFEMKGEVVTPLPAFQQLGLGIAHKFDGSRYLFSSVNGTYNKDYMTVGLQVKNRGDIAKSDLGVSLNVNSSLATMRIVAVSLTHKLDGGLYDTQALYRRNDMLYSASMKTLFNKGNKNLDVNSTFNLQLPDDRSASVQVVYQEDQTLTLFNSSIKVLQKDNNLVLVNFGANFDKRMQSYSVNTKMVCNWDSFKGLDLDYKHNMLNSISGSGTLFVRTSPNVRSTLTYSGTQLQLKSSYHPYMTDMLVKYENYPFTLLLEHKNPRTEDKKISLEGSLNLRDQSEAAFEINLITPYENVKNIDVKCEVKKALEATWELDSLISLDTRKKVQITGKVDTGNWTMAHGQITTPYKQLTDLNFGYDNRADVKWDVREMYLEVQPYFNKVRMEQNLTMEMPFGAKMSLDLPDLDIKYLKLDVVGSKVRNGYNYDVLAKYHPNQELSLKLKSKYNANKFPQETSVSLNVVTPFRYLPKLDSKLNIDKEKDKWIGQLDLAANSLIMKLKETLSTSMSYSDFEISSPDIEPVAAGVHVDWSDLVGLNVSLRAPSIGRTVLGFKQRSTSWTNFQNKVFGEYNGKELDLDLGLAHDDQQTKFWLIYVYPGASNSFLKASVHKVGNSARDFDVGGFLQLGRSSKPFNVSMQYAFTDEKLSLGTTLETPYTESLAYYLSRTARKGHNEAKAYGKYSSIFLADFFVSNNITPNTYDYTLRNEYQIHGKNYKFGTDINFRKPEDLHYEVNVNGYLNKDWAKINVLSEGNKLPVESFSANFLSNIHKFNDVGLSGSIKKNKEILSGTFNIEYMDDNEAKVTFTSNNPTASRANLEVILELPKVVGYNRNTLSYSHETRDLEQVTSSARVVTGLGEVLNVKVSYKNKKVTVDVTGPIREFEFLKLSGQFDENKQQILGNADLKLMTSIKPAALAYDISLNDYKPLIMNFKLKSPFENFKSTSLTIHHEFQSWGQMTTTSRLQLDNLGDVDGQFHLKLDSPLNLELKGQLTSEIRNMESIKLYAKSEDRDRSHSSQLQFGWQPNKVITLLNKWVVIGSDENIKLTSSFELMSPFDEVRSANIKVDHSYSPKMISESIQFTHNDKTYMDADLYYQNTMVHNASVVIKSPRPMSLTVTGSADTGKLNGNLKLNWDKLSTDSHVEVNCNYLDQSDSQNTDMTFKLKVLHPVRTMGVESTHRKSEKELYSSSQVTWDEEQGNLLGYDVNWMNLTSRYNQKYEGHVKLSLPQRSVKVQGSYTDTGSSMTTNSALLWDADKDDKKRLTIQTEVENKANGRRVALNVNLPNINKQLVISGFTKGPYGTTLIDSKAEISYSSDPQKMITIRSLISNFEIESKDNYNYTAQFEFQHPKTNSDVKLVSHIAHVEKVCSAGGHLSFVTATQQRKFVEVWSILDTGKQSMTLRVASPLRTISMQGNLVDFASHKDLTLTTYENDKETTALDVKIDQKREELHAEFNYDRDDPTKILKLTGRYVNNSAVQITVISQNGVQTSEGVISVRLNTSEILHTRVAWRPMLFNDVKNFIGSKITSFTYIANEVFNSSVTHIGADLKSRYLLISQELATEIGHVLNLMNTELGIISAQLNSYSTELRRIIQRNDLHLQELGDTISSAVYLFNQNLLTLIRSYNYHYHKVSRAMTEFSLQLKNHPVAERYAIAVKELVHGLMTARQVLEKALNDATENLDKFSHVTYKAYLDVSRSLDQKLQSYSRSVYEMPLYQNMMKRIERLGQQGSQMLPDWLNMYNSVYVNVHKILQDQFHDMMARSEFQQTYAMLNEIHQQITYWRKEQKLDMAAQNLVEMSKNLLLLELVKLRSTLMNSRIIVYDPEAGELQFELHLPFTLESLKEKPKLTLNTVANTVQQWANSNIPKNLPVVLNNYYNSLPSLSPSSYMPTFQASAYLLGGQHIFTFDKANYEFLSPCSYILTHDMLHDNFSVVFNYKQGQKKPVKSLCITVEDSLNFEISDDYKLKVQSRDTEMPFVTDKVTVTRLGDYINVAYAGGLEVVSNPKIDLYKVTVDGWYHGRVKGMLGHFDNEILNDVVNEKDFDDFEVDRKNCDAKNLATAVTVNENDKCFEIFNSSSSIYRPCFNKIHPAPFVKICQIYKQSKTEEESVYLATEQYRFMCQDQGVHLSADFDYAPCNSDEGLIVDGNDPLYQSADVVFIVEDNTCNQWAMSSLGKIVTELNKVFNIPNFKNNTFGMVSYGGMMNAATARTINGQHFGKATDFLKALETMRFSTNETEGDLIKAIMMAMNYPFRPGVAKVLIAIPCSTCEVSFIEKNMLTYELLSQSFNLNILRKQPFDDVASKYKTYGIGDGRVHSTNGQEPLIAYYTENLSDCDLLALKTSGSIFDSIFMKEKTNIQNEFIRVLTNTVGVKAAKLPTCQSCECDAETGKVRCDQCNQFNVLRMFSPIS